MILKLHRNDVTIGEPPKVGDIAKDFTVTTTDFSKVSLSDIKSKVVVISSYPSVDTSVCEIQVVNFVREISKIKNVELLNISCDLPFALKRFCADKGIKNSRVLSDWNGHNFGNTYGLLVKEFNILARTVIILNEKREVVYIEICDEITHQVNFKEALKAINSLI